jgi:hypothetical protein
MSGRGGNESRAVLGASLWTGWCTPGTGVNLNLFKTMNYK